MFKNQLQELAQRSCFNLPSYACKREGPDHAPRFKACVNFNGEVFESPTYSPTLRQAEHSAAELALNTLSSRGSKSLTARVLDETGVYKNLLQETAHKAGLNLPVYTTIRTGPGHVPVFTCTVELAGMTFTGDSAKTKKQAEKYAAITAWSSLKKMPSLFPKNESKENEGGEQDQEIVKRVLSSFRPQKSGRQKDQFHHHRRSRNARSWRPNHSQISADISFKHLSAATNSTTQHQHKESFVDLLPPPPPRSSSIILPLTSKTKTITKFHHDYTMQKPQKQAGCYYQNNFGNLYVGPESSSSLSCAQMGIMGNYSTNLNGIAPAVQIRSVIPVCATPPSSSVKPMNLNLSKQQELSSFSSTINLTSELSRLHLKDQD
ncbi:unnamed protein product [Amaranthus hypochondriacus]